MSAAALRLAFFYVALFLASGVQLPFWPVWLASRGLSGAEIGALLAITQWIKVAANPLAGTIADRSRDRPRFMALLGLLCLAGYTLCLPGRSFLALLLPSTLVAASAAALLPLGDGLALAIAASGRLDYGRARLWGTIAFIAATLLSGRLLTGQGADIILYLLIATAALATIACAALPRIPVAARPSLRAAWRGLLTPRHLTFLGAASLVQASHAAYYAFGTLHWQRLGFADTTIAWLWAEGAIAEILLFFLGQTLVRRCGPLLLLCLGGIAGVLRWTATGLVTALLPVALLQPLHAFTFGAAHLGAMHYLARAVPTEQSGTTQSLYYAVVGAGFGLATLLTGALYGRVGGAGAYLAMATMAGAGGLIAMLLARLPPRPSAQRS